MVCSINSESASLCVCVCLCVRLFFQANHLHYVNHLSSLSFIPIRKLYHVSRCTSSLHIMRYDGQIPFWLVLTRFYSTSVRLCKMASSLDSITRWSPSRKKSAGRTKAPNYKRHTHTQKNSASKSQHKTRMFIAIQVKCECIKHWNDACYTTYRNKVTVCLWMLKGSCLIKFSSTPISRMRRFYESAYIRYLPNLHNNCCLCTFATFASFSSPFYCTVWHT